MASATTYDMNLLKLCQQFGSEDRCRAYLEKLRWPDGVECPRCQCKTVSSIHDRDQFDCDSCRYQFSVTAGTIMHDTKLPLWKWFLAVYMIVESKKGVSANQLKRTIEVSYRTAWYLCHRIRKALETEDSYLRGVVEIDESYIGGATAGRGKGHRNKTLVIGAVERKGDVRMKAVGKGEYASSSSVGKFVRANISDDAKCMTDEATWYVAHIPDNRRNRVNHSDKEWVRGDVHTNGIEGAWSLFKRSVVGSYHQVSCKHLPAYLDEFEFRFNNRDNPFIFRDAMVKVLEAGNVEYSELVAGA
jgi:transposase-like protein